MRAPETAANAGRNHATPRIGLALGGGSARGLAHILMLEVFDELGVTPCFIAGTSIGAIMGSCYAAGLTGADMRAYADDLLKTRMGFLKRLSSHFPDGFSALWSLKSLPVFDGVTLMEIMMPEAVRCDFSALRIPFTAVTADYYAIEQVCISHGPVIPAVAASSALPTLMRPVVIEGRVLIDGGFVNPTPFDIVMPKADITVAVDVTGDTGKRKGKDIPGSMEAMVGASQIMFHSITREKRKVMPPQIFIRPAVGGFGTMDFFKMPEIFAAALPAKEDLKRRLGEAIESWQQ